MNLNEFIPQAVRTESRINSVKVNKEFLQTALAIYVSSGRILDQIKKNVFYNKPYNVEKLMENFDPLNAISKAVRTDGWDRQEIEEEIYKKELIDMDPRVFHAIIGIMTEATELAEQLLKGVQGEEVDRVNLLEEVGDNFWYIAVLLDALQSNPDNVLETVIEKLKARFPDKFTSEAAINRNTKKERKILEKNIK